MRRSRALLFPRLLTIVWIFFITALSLVAQRREIKPRLPNVRPPAAATRAAAPLYQDISGTYSFLGDEEFVQIALEGGKLTGFVSRYGDLPSDRGVLLDQFFSRGTASADKIAFATQPVHGAWFEFTGHVRRGESSKSRNREGFYIIEGELTEYFEDQELKITARKRQAIFKSLPEDVNAEAESTHKR